MSITKSVVRTATKTETFSSVQEKSITEGRVIDVPFTEKNEAKELGAQWDSVRKTWVIPKGKDEKVFAKWFSSRKLNSVHGNDSERYGSSASLTASVSGYSNTTSHTATSSAQQSFYHRDHIASSNHSASAAMGHQPLKDGVSYVAYVDGSCLGNSNVNTQVNKAGFGVAILMKDREDGELKLTADIKGPIITDSNNPNYIGAEKGSNNTAELSAIGFAFKWLQEIPASIVIRSIEICYDSEYAAKSVLGIYNGKENRMLIERVRKLYEGCKRRVKAGGIRFTHVKGHSNDKWNDYVDNIAKEGCHLQEIVTSSKSNLVVKQAEPVDMHDNRSSSLPILSRIGSNNNSENGIATGRMGINHLHHLHANANNSNSLNAIISNDVVGCNTVINHNRLIREEDSESKILRLETENRRLLSEVISLKSRILELEKVAANSNLQIVESSNEKRKLPSRGYSELGKNVDDEQSCAYGSDDFASDCGHVYKRASSDIPSNGIKTTSSTIMSGVIVGSNEKKNISTSALVAENSMSKEKSSSIEVIELFESDSD